MGGGRGAGAPRVVVRERHRTVLISVAALLVVPLLAAPPTSAGPHPTHLEPASPIAARLAPTGPEQTVPPRPILSTDPRPGSGGAIGGVVRTTVLFNGTVVDGNFNAAPVPYPYSLAVVPSTNSLWVAGCGLGRVSLATDELVYVNGSAADPYCFDGLVYDPLHNTLYTTSHGPTFDEWNATTGAHLKTIHIYSPVAMALDPVTDELYLAEGSGNVTVLNTTTDRTIVVDNVNNNPLAIAFDPVTDSMYVTNGGPFFGGTPYVSVINGSTHHWFDTNLYSPPNGYPTAVVYDSANGSMVVSEVNPDRLGLLNASNGTLMAGVSIPVGLGSLCYDPVTGNLSGETGSGSFQLFRGNFSTDGSAPVDWGTDCAYVAASNWQLVAASQSYAGGGVVALNASTNQYAATFNLSGPVPNGLIFGGASGPLFAAAIGQGDLWTVDPQSGVVGPIIGPPTFAGAYDVEYDSALDRVFVSYYDNNSVTAWNASSPYRDVQAVQVNVTPASGPLPEGMAVDQADGTLLVADESSNDISILQLADLSNQTVLSLGGNPSDVVLAPAMHEFVTMDLGSGQATIFNSTSLAIVGSVSAGNGPEFGAYDPAANAIVMSDSGGHTVAILDLTNRTTRLEAVGDNPAELAYDNVTGEVYVANTGSGNVSVLDATTLRVIGSIPVGAGPAGLAVEPGTGDIAVGNGGSDTISWIQPCPYVSCISVASFDASPSTVQVRGTTLLTTTLEDAVGTVQFAYTGLPPGCASANVSVLSCSPTVPGLFNVTVVATDSTGTSALANLTLLALLPPGPFISDFQAVPASFVLGNQTFLSATVSGGLTPYEYSYGGLPPGCASANESYLLCQPAAMGNFDITLVVNSSFGAAASSSLNLTVTAGPGPEITTLAAASAILLGGTLQLSAAVSGGWGWLTYDWSGLPPGCTPTNRSDLSCVPSEWGNSTVTLLVSDGLGRTASSSASVEILPPLATVQSISFSPAPAYAESNLTIRVSYLDDISDSRVVLYGLPPGCSSTGSTVLNCVPTEAGTYFVTANVSDWTHRPQTLTLPLIVQAAVPVPAIGAFTASPAQLVLGTSTILGVSETGGLSPVRYSYSNLPTGCASANSPTLVCTPQSIGNWTVLVSVVDGLNRTASASATVSVTASPGRAVQSTPASPVWPWIVAGIAVAGLGAMGILVLHRRNAARRSGPPTDSPKPDSPGT